MGLGLVPGGFEVFLVVIQQVRVPKFCLLIGHEFLSKIDAAQVRAQWVIFKVVLLQEKKETL